MTDATINGDTGARSGTAAQDELAALGEVIRAVSASGFDLDEVLQTIIRHAVELSRAEFGNILRPEPEGRFFSVVAYHGQVSQAYWDIVTKNEYVPERQAAELIGTETGTELLAGHRREITAMFCDLRGFTAFAESAEPEEVLNVLREYHAAVGEIVVRSGGTVEHFAGDGLMCFFNDPRRLDDHQHTAVEAAIEIRDRFVQLARGWSRRGYELGLGIGLAVGHATLGRIGFEGRFDYGAVGNVVILASRLSDVADTGEILLSQRLNAAVEERMQTEALPERELKGFSRPVPIFRVAAPRALG